MRVEQIRYLTTHHQSLNRGLKKPHYEILIDYIAQDLETVEV